MLQLTSRRFLRELDEAPGGNNLQYILKCPYIPFFGNQGLHNEIMLGGNGGRSGVMCEGSPYIIGLLTWMCYSKVGYEQPVFSSLSSLWLDFFFDTDSVCCL